ncbi:uncharacterized protein TNCT_87251 [Trichonephila clavata]|uniref:Uncharacterized protein n=1 Tax=Trichonephila clavata TaxID=2740835 RepID=A0A8X6GRQ3_TRICU|nr:uncharacterized protein TNCT_87251 [Trichonephila clavata]
MFAVANEMANRLDEVTTYQQGRYISSSEAVWHLLNFPIHQRYPTVVHLAVHLEEGQRIYFEPGQPTAHLTDTPPKTTLTAFFISAKQTLLQKHCCILKCLDIFTGMPVKGSGKSEKGVPLANFPGYVTDNALERVYTAHPNDREAFHVLLLLHHVRGPISFEDLKTVIVRDEDVTSLKLSHAAHTLRHAKSWDCWKIILIGTSQWKRQLCLSHQHSSVTALPFWLQYVA